MTPAQMLEENERRRQRLLSPFDPITGEGSTGERVEVRVSGLGCERQFWPAPMAAHPLVQALMQAGSVGAMLLRAGAAERAEWDVETEADVRRAVERLRCLHDFPYWAARYVYIKKKGGGDDVLFRLTYPQRLFVERLEQDRLAGKPVRLVVLKARQWGGSTTSQLYMAWLQLVHSTGLNSLIIAHQGAASDEIRDMFDRMMRRYPVEMLHAPGEECKPTEKKTENVGRSGASFRVIQRNCKVKIGTAERPDSCRGGDYNLVHLSEVGLWRLTDGKRPEDIVRSACSGVLYHPLTMIVYESTANGVGNFFHREYIDARDNPRSQFRALFVPWYIIEQNMAAAPPEFILPEARHPAPVPTHVGMHHGASETKDAAPRCGSGPCPGQKDPWHTFAAWLIDRRDREDTPSSREEPGRYLWLLWERGATLEGISWYITERAKHTSHGSMAAECPTDDTEAFVNSGAQVFDKYRVEALRAGCSHPLYTGDIDCAAPGVRGLVMPRVLPTGSTRSVEGPLSIWEFPASESAEPVAGRYLTVVDVGGRGERSDWSVAVVFDRADMAVGGVPRVVAQWRGHTDIDLLAWKAAALAAYYGQSLLVIESNTLETHDMERQVDGDQSMYILHQLARVYPNLYARRSDPDEVRRGLPRRYGFHTNVATKPMVITTLVKMVRERLYTERDERCLDEMLVYERRQNGSYGAVSGAHDDMLMTRAIGLHICYHEMALPRTVPSGMPRPRLSGPLSEASLF